MSKKPATFRLAKFDGFNWTNIDTSNSNLPHNALAVTQSDKAGVLWMGFQGGTSAYLPGLTSFNGQSFTSYDTINSTILSNGLWDIQTDKENNIWVGCINGFSKFDGQSFTNYLVDFPNSFGGVPDLLYKIPLVFGFLHLVASYTITLSPIPQRFTT